MEPVKVLASGLTLEESKAKRQEKQAARYRHRFGTYVPSGDSQGLLEALMATSPRKSPTPRKSIASGSTKPRKSAKTSLKGKSNDETADESIQEMEKQTKPKKSTGRKSTRAVDSSGKQTQAGVSEKKASKRHARKPKVNAVEDEDQGAPKPSTSRQTNKSTSNSNPKVTKSSKKSAATKRLKVSKASSYNTGVEDDSDNRPATPEPVQHKLRRPSTKPSPTQPDESDDPVIKKTEVSKKTGKEKAKAAEPPPETFESAGTDLEDPHPGLSSANPPSTEGKPLRDVHETITTPVVLRSRGDVSEKPPPKKRRRPRKDEVGEEPPPKRGKTQKADDGEAKDLTKSKSKQQAKRSPSEPGPTATKSRRKKTDTQPDTNDAEKEEHALPETKTSGSNTRKRQRRTLDDGSSDETRYEPPDSDELNPNRVRLDSIPPEGVVIRKKNGIVERLLPLVIKPKRKAPSNRGKTRNSRKRAIPAHVLKYIGPTRIGSPLKAEGTDTDDDLNL